METYVCVDVVGSSLRLLPHCGLRQCMWGLHVYCYGHFNTELYLHYSMITYADATNMERLLYLARLTSYRSGNGDGSA